MDETNTEESRWQIHRADESKHYKPKTVFTHGTDAEANIPQPNPTTGEWTVARIHVIQLNDGDMALAKAINAALAARDKEWRLQYQKLDLKREQQLATEREKWMALCDKASDNATKAEQALAAEQEITDDLREQLAGAVNEHHKVCQNQLTAEQVKCQTLVDALKESREIHESMRPDLPVETLLRLSMKYQAVIATALINDDPVVELK